LDGREALNFERMADPKTPQPPHDDNEPQVVYRRADASVSSTSQGSTGLELAPTLTPLIIGFAILLMVTSVLGYLSVHRIEDVGRQVLSLEQGHAARANLLLQLRLALTRLDNEARARQDAEAGRGLKPPLDLPLSTRRDEIKPLITMLERPPLTQEPKWVEFHNELKTYVAITEDARRYSLEGFPQFHKVDAQLNDLFTDSNQQQTEIFVRSDEIQQQAAKSIRLWSAIALVVGFLVAVGTIWEVQRRFNQVRRSIEQLRRERVFSNQMLEGMVSAVVAIDRNDRIRSANRSFFEIFPGASIGAFVSEKFAPEPVMNMLEAATAGPLVEQSAYRGRWVTPVNGSNERSFDVYSSPLEIDGETGQLVSLVDVTDAAEAERVMRRNESLAAMGQATAQVAHEIKNPLGSIRLGVSMLRDSVRGDNEALRTIDLVERGVNHLNKLVIDVTEYSRQKPLSRSQVELADLLNRSLELVSERISDKSTPITKSFSDHALRGSWDADQLVQVFVNIIANAIDASPKGQPISVASEFVNLSGNGAGGTHGAIARVVISDHGNGMSKEISDRIFEPFFTTKKRGTGLGLAIVKQIVEQHGGKISVVSDEGKGSTFTIDLPL